MSDSQRCCNDFGISSSSNNITCLSVDTLELQI